MRSSMALKKFGLFVGILMLLISPSTAIAQAADGPFYYARGQKIPLQLVPKKFVVAIATPDEVQAIRESAGLGQPSPVVEVVPVARLSKLPFLPSKSRLRIYEPGKAGQEDGKPAGPALPVLWKVPVYRVVGEQTEVYLTDQIAIRFAAEVARESILTLIESQQVTLVKDDTEGRTWFVVRVPRERVGDVLDIANALYERSDTVWATPDFRAELRFLDVSDPLFPDQWHLHNDGSLPDTILDQDVDALEAWYINPAGTGIWDDNRGSGAITVSVQDDAVQHAHPDLGDFGLYLGGKDIADDDDDPSPTGPSENHGTACAGLAIATSNTIGVRGVAPRCSLMAVRMPGTPAATELADAFVWSRQHGAAVISNSWSWPVVSDVLNQAIEDAATLGREGKGCVVLFAAGNGQCNGGAAVPVSDPDDGSPQAVLDEVICVGAVTSMGEHSNYSNFGLELDVVAPSSPGYDFDAGQSCGVNPNSPQAGSDIVTTDRTGTNGYADADYTYDFGGTSAATPITAGVCAMILSADPDLTEAEVKQVLYSTTDEVTDPRYLQGSPDYTERFGNGKVNAFNAVEEALLEHYTTGELRLTEPIGVSYELNPPTIWAGTTYELDGLVLNSGQKASMDRVVAAWLILDIEDVDHGTELSVETSTGRLISDCPPTGSGNRRPVIMSIPPSELVLQDEDEPFVLRNNDFLVGYVNLYEATLRVLYVSADSETDPEITGGWRFPQMGVPGSAVGWAWGYLDSDPEHVQIGQPLTEQAFTSSYKIQEVLGARVFVTASAIAEGEATLKINGTTIGTLPMVTDDADSVRTRYVGVPDNLLSSILAAGTNTLSLEGADFHVHNWGLTLDFRGEAVQPPDEPHVIRTSPIHGGPLVDPAANVEITFSEPMNPVTMTPATVFIDGSVSGSHSATFAYNPSNMTLTLNPDSGFTLGEVVTVTATSAIEAEDGTPLVGHVFHFNIRPGETTVQQHSGVLTVNETWSSDFVHVVTNYVRVDPGVVLTIEPGTVVKFDDYDYLDVNGVLLAQGTVSDPIVFTAVWDDTYGGDSGDGSTHWRTIWLYGNGSVMDHTLVRYGGYTGSSYDSMVHVNSDSLVQNSTLENLYGSTSYYNGAIELSSAGELRYSVVRSNSYGVAVSGSGATLVGNTITQNTYPVVQAASANIDYYTNDIANNTYNVITFSSGTIDGLVTWSPHDELPYLVQSDVTVNSGATLMIEGDTIVKFTGSTSPSSTDHRSLVVNGTILTTASVENPVVFTSFRDDDWSGDSNGDGTSSGIRGDWGGLVLKTTNNVIDNMVFRYGGGQRNISGIGNTYGLLVVSGNDSEIRYCNFAQYYDAAVRVKPGAQPFINNCNLLYTGAYGIYNEGTLLVDAEYNYWGDPSGPSGEGSGSGAAVSTYVDYSPWDSEPVPPPTAGPVITSTPNLTAQVSVPYQYDADGCASASGTGTTTWSKLRGPEDFLIDTQNGCINWLPTAGGYIVITIAATDEVATETQTFQVFVTGLGGDTAPPRVSDFSAAISGIEGETVLTILFTEDIFFLAPDIAILDSTGSPISLEWITYWPKLHRLNVGTLAIVPSQPYELLLADSIVDATWNPLDGEWDGQTFPSGNGMPGGDFVAPFVGPGTVLGDMDGDGDIDTDDLAVLVGCMNGPELAYGVGCEDADLTGDGDVDLEDFSDFQQLFMGPLGSVRFTGEDGYIRVDYGGHMRIELESTTR